MRKEITKIIQIVKMKMKLQAKMKGKIVKIVLEQLLQLKMKRKSNWTGSVKNIYDYYCICQRTLKLVYLKIE